MTKKFSNEQTLLLNLLSLLFTIDIDMNNVDSVRKIFDAAQESGAIDWHKFIDIADKHCVLSLLYDILDRCSYLEKNLQIKLKSVSRSIVLQNYHLLFLGKSIIELLDRENIETVLLKGSICAEYYPIPELRKSGDIDLLLLDSNDYKRVESLFLKIGMVKELKRQANHHVVFYTKEGIEVEVHVMLTEPFDNSKSNHYFESVYKKCKNHKTYIETIGIKFPVLDEGYNGFYLLTHMLQHFLRSGFGIKLLCDWTAFWRSGIDEKNCKMFVDLVSECGLLKFSKVITAACIGYIGLDSHNMEFMFGKKLSVMEARQISEKLMFEVLEAEEFGRSSTDRMVMLRGNSFAHYIREFHHQMRLNFPLCGKLIILWPALWVITFIKFADNNRRLRKISGRAVIKKAGERSRLMKELGIFK